MLHGPSNGAFTRNEIKSDIPTDNFGLLMCPSIRLNELQNHLYWNSVLQYKTISIMNFVACEHSKRVNYVKFSDTFIKGCT